MDDLGRAPLTGEIVEPGDIVAPPTVAAWLGIPVPALFAAAERGDIPALRDGVTWRFHGPTVRRWMLAERSGDG